MGLEYYAGDVEKDKFKISPSQLSSFFNDSAEWFRKNVTKDEVFEGNTNTVLGTVVHYFAECYANNKKPNIIEIEDFINSYNDNPEVDVSEVKKNYKGMVDVLKSEYLEKSMTPTEVEPFIKYELEPGFVVAGSVDARIGKTVVDYKTCKVKPSGMDKHRLQLMTYAYIYSKLGIDIEKIRVVYVQRATKTLPPRIWEFEEEVTFFDFNWIEEQLKIVSGSLKLYQQYPHLKDILFRDNPTSMFKKREKGNLVDRGTRKPFGG